MYVIYKKSNGEILRRYTGPAEFVRLQCQEGESAVYSPTEVAGDTHHVVGGVISALPAIRVRPSEHHKWDEDLLHFYDPRTLAEIREQTWEKVKGWRAAAIDAPLSTPYGAVDSKENDRKNITDAVMLAQTLAGMSQPVAIEFTMADNSVVVMDASMMTNVGLLLGQKTQAAHARARELRAQIATATKEQLAALTWD